MTRRILLCAIVAIASATSASAATIVIDDFNNTSFQVVGAPSLGTSPQNPATTSGPTSDAIGGTRTITNTRTSPPGNANAFGQQVQSVVTGGQASVSLGAATEGFSVFSWPLGATVDLSDGGLNDLLSVEVLTTDIAVSFAFSIDGTDVVKPISSPGVLTFGFGEFGGIDFANVGAISLTIAGPASFDVMFDNVIATASNVTAVPLPAALPLFTGGLGLLGLVGWRRRRKVAATA